MNTPLVRRGKLAKALGIPEPTVKYYTQMRLFESAGKTPNGHLLYDVSAMQARYLRIKEFKRKRLTIPEILERFFVEKV